MYIHVPFCRSKCPYCGFYSLASVSLIPRWLQALQKEIDIYCGTFYPPFDSLYFGGGTPTILATAQLQEIMDHLFNRYNFQEGTEITIEANPGDIDFIKSKELKAMGFNRINLGIQSFDNDDLQFLGRRHNAHEGVQAFQQLRTAGYDNIGIDLIYGLKDQTLGSWKINLEKALALRPEHISCYQLTMEKGTQFWSMKNKGLLESPDQETEESFFLTTSEFLESHGYIHYEISNFAKDESCYSRHNRKYWDRSPYLGLGPSAHSFDGASRWWNQASVRKYCEALEKMESPVEEKEMLTQEQVLMETVSLGLRTKWGLKRGLLGDNKDIEKNIAMLEERKYIRFDGDRVIPTKKGFLIADRLPLYFLD
jgi:oxygen-independent coproporphyrinogen III oxidase